MQKRISSAFFTIFFKIYSEKSGEASRGVEAQACDCKRDGLWVRLQLQQMECLIFYFLALKTRPSAQPQHVMPPECVLNCETEVF